MESIVFHARKNEEDRTPVYTVRFAKETSEQDPNSPLLCVVSKPHKSLESYSKKIGYHLTSCRLLKLAEELLTHTPVQVGNTSELAKFLPRGITKNLYFYAGRASRFFKLDNPKLVIRGSKLTWKKSENSRFDVTVHKETTIVETQLSNIIPIKN